MKWPTRRWHVHRWYVALMLLWLLVWGSILLALSMRTATSELYLLPLGLVTEVIGIARDEGLFGLIVGLFFFLPLIFVPIGLTESTHPELY